MRKASLR